MIGARFDQEIFVANQSTMQQRVQQVLAKTILGMASFALVQKDFHASSTVQQTILFEVKSWVFHLLIFDQCSGGFSPLEY